MSFTKVLTSFALSFALLMFLTGSVYSEQVYTNRTESLTKLPEEIISSFTQPMDKSTEADTAFCHEVSYHENIGYFGAVPIQSTVMILMP